MDLEKRAIDFLKRYKVVNLVKGVLKTKDKIFRKNIEYGEIAELNNYIEYTNRRADMFLNSKLDEKLKIFEKKLDDRKYKGIVVYPVAINWEPIQRPHHILRELGKRGYLCFFCSSHVEEEFEIIEKYENVYLVNNQEKLLPLIKRRHTIVLITYFLQYLYAKNIENKTIWLDVLDRLDFMSLYNEKSIPIWNEVIDRANLITYSADNLHKEYLKNRPDAIMIENAVNIEDFKLNDIVMPKDMERVINRELPILGYYGAIESWFDFNLIKKLDDKYNIIVIGKVNESLDIEQYKFKSVYFLGQKEFKDLKNYAKYFDVALIPFVVNDMTNSVSPVKFFEYMALAKPTISSGIKEVKKFSSPVVRIVDSDNIVAQVEELLKIEKNEIKKETQKIAISNTWKNRVDSVIDYL